VFPAAATGDGFPRRREGRDGRVRRRTGQGFCNAGEREEDRGQALLYTIGRHANSDKMKIEAAGLAADGRGKLEVNENFQTAVPHIYAAGDVIGFPALASTSMEQGRLASCHMFGKPNRLP